MMVDRRTQRSPKDIRKSTTEAGLGGSTGGQAHPKEGDQESEEEMLEHISTEGRGKGGVGGNEIHNTQVGQNRTGG
jgi:hypothetical protein